MDNWRYIFVHSSGTEVQEHSDIVAVQFFDAIVVGNVAAATTDIETFPGICGHHAIGPIANCTVDVIVRHHPDTCQWLSTCKEFRHQFRIVGIS